MYNWLASHRLGAVYCAPRYVICSGSWIISHPLELKLDCVDGFLISFVTGYTSVVWIGLPWVPTLSIHEGGFEEDS